MHSTSHILGIVLQAVYELTSFSKGFFEIGFSLFLMVERSKAQITQQLENKVAGAQSQEV